MNFDPNLIDEEILTIINYYYISAQMDYQKTDNKESHIFHSIKLVKDLYDNGGPQDNF